jgi:hypothetical protein
MRKHWEAAELETLFRWLTDRYGRYAKWQLKFHPRGRGDNQDYLDFLGEFALLSGAKRRETVGWCVTAAIAYFNGDAFLDRPYVARLYQAASKVGFF